MTAPAKPETHNADLGHLPRALRQLTEQKHWLNWNWEWRNNKWTKIPIQPPNLRLASSNDPDTWSTYKHAVQRWRNHDADGIGYTLLGADIAAIDLDDCCRRDAVHKKTKIDEWAKRLRSEANGAYVEVTVSGTGLRLIGTAAGAEVHRRFNNVAHGRENAHIELFRNTARFITVSGIRLSQIGHLELIDNLIDTTLAHYDRVPRRRLGQQRRRLIDYDDVIEHGAAEGERSDLSSLRLAPCRSG